MFVFPSRRTESLNPGDFELVVRGKSSGFLKGGSAPELRFVFLLLMVLAEGRSLRRHS